MPPSLQRQLPSLSPLELQLPSRRPAGRGEPGAAASTFYPWGPEPPSGSDPSLSLIPADSQDRKWLSRRPRESEQTPGDSEGWGSLACSRPRSRKESDATGRLNRGSKGRRGVTHLRSCPTLCGPIDGSPPGSPVPGILQARTLQRAAISFSTLHTYMPPNQTEPRGADVWQVPSLMFSFSCSSS